MPRTAEISERAVCLCPYLFLICFFFLSLSRCRTFSVGSRLLSVHAKCEHEKIEIENSCANPWTHKGLANVNLKQIVGAFFIFLSGICHVGYKTKKNHTPSRDKKFGKAKTGFPSRAMCWACVVFSVSCSIFYFSWRCVHERCAVSVSLSHFSLRQWWRPRVQFSLIVAHTLVSLSLSSFTAFFPRLVQQSTESARVDGATLRFAKVSINRMNGHQRSRAHCAPDDLKQSIYNCAQ